MDKKNITIAVLAGLVIIGSLWGSVGNRNSKVLRQQLEEMKAQLASVQAVSSQSHDAVLTKTAKLQKVLQQKEVWLTKARNELISLRKANKSLEAKLSECNAAGQKLLARENRQAAGIQGAVKAQLAALHKKAGSLQARIVTLQNALKGKDSQLAEMTKQATAAAQQIAVLKKENAALKAEMNKISEQVAGKAGAAATAKVAALQKNIADLQQQIKQKDMQIAQLQAAMKKMQAATAAMEKSAKATREVQKEQPEPTVVVVKEEDRNQDQGDNGGCLELEKAKAQILGLEKIVEEKNAAVEELSQELDRVKINMDVLLSKIADQQDSLQEVQEENGELVKELAAKNEECADLQEQLQKNSGQ